MSERPDLQAVQNAQRGDATAIGELFSQYWRAARAAAFGVTGEFASAEDAAAEAFVEAFANLASLRELDRFGPWLRTIAVRKARSAVRRNHAGIDGLAEQMRDSAEGLDDALLRLELQCLLRRAIGELPRLQREAIALFYFEGYDSKDAARLLGIPGGTLRRRLHQARTRLRRSMEEMIQRRDQMNERTEQVEELRKMLGNDDIYRSLRQCLTMRPPAGDLLRMLAHRQTLSGGPIRQIQERLTQPSARATDILHPVGAVATAIRMALPKFEEWKIEIGASAGPLLRALPPGFPEGRSGQFVRATRALIRMNGSGGAETIYELLQASELDSMFQAGMGEVRLSDVLDLYWMSAGAVELRSVQALVQHIASSVLPAVPIQFSSYDEPRYRSALQFQLGCLSVRAGCGGVLGRWPDCPGGVEAAHVRIFLEPWAALLSREGVEFEALPDVARMLAE